MNGKAYVFINFKQALRLGHIGWGFYLGNGQYYFGSTDHLWRDNWWNLCAALKYIKVEPLGHNDWWSAAGEKEDMLRQMKHSHHVRYHAYKSIAIENANPQQAKSMADSMRQVGWDAAGNNCVHQTYRILCAYGAAPHLTDPACDLWHLVPRRWFASIPAETSYL